MYPENLKYTEDHEWVRVENGKAYIGVTNYAQDQLGDVVFLELPEEGEEYEMGESFGVIESVKTVSDLFMPVDGKIAGVNEKLNDNPELINEDPYGDGWVVVIEIRDESQLDQLMDNQTYEKTIE